MWVSTMKRSRIIVCEKVGCKEKEDNVNEISLTGKSEIVKMK